MHWNAEHKTEPEVGVGAVFVLENGKKRYVIDAMNPDHSFHYHPEYPKELTTAESEASALEYDYAVIQKTIHKEKVKSQIQDSLESIARDIDNGLDSQVCKQRIEKLIRFAVAESKALYLTD